MTHQAAGPGVFQEENGQWSYREFDGSEYGPFDFQEDAARGYEYSEDNRLNRKHRARPEAERAILEFNALDEQIRTLEEQLRDTKARRKYIGENEMIEVLFPEERTDGVRLSDGTEWTFEQKFECSVPDEHKEKVYAYLTQTGQDAMLRTTVTVSFAKDAHAAAKEFQKMLATTLPEYELSLKVGKMPQLLLLSIKEMLKAMNVMPMVNVNVEYELPGATMRAWVIKKMKQGIQLPDGFTVYAPLKPQRVLTPESMPSLPETPNP